MESFGKGDVNMYLGDGYTMLNDVVGHKSADLVILDNPFKLALEKKLWMYSAAASVIKDDGVLIAFDSIDGWRECSIATDYFHVFGNYILHKNRPMKLPNATTSKINTMVWMTPHGSELSARNTQTLGYLANSVMTKDTRIEDIWRYNTSDKLGSAAQVPKPHRGAKSLGIAGFLIDHFAKHMRRDKLVIADPYGGSGTFAIAASLLGHTCYSAEIVPEIFASAKVKFVYALDKANKEPHWFKDSIRTVQKRVTGGEAIGRK